MVGVRPRPHGLLLLARLRGRWKCCPHYVRPPHQGRRWLLPHQRRGAEALCWFKPSRFSKYSDLYHCLTCLPVGGERLHLSRLLICKNVWLKLKKNQYFVKTEMEMKNLVDGRFNVNIGFISPRFCSRYLFTMSLLFSNWSPNK